MVTQIRTVVPHGAGSRSQAYARLDDTKVELVHQVRVCPGQATGVLQVDSETHAVGGIGEPAVMKMRILALVRNWIG